MGSFETFQNEQVAGDGSLPKKINSLLNSPKTRVEGLELLNSFLPQCPDEDFLQFCISWMQNCCKVDGLIKNKDYAILLLSDLFKASSNFQELKKSVSFFITTRYLDFFFKHLLHSQAGWSCTETCMLLYRGACGPFQENFSRHFESEIERDVKISPTVARCYALLPSVGGGGNEGIHYMKNWRSQFVKFLSIGHSLLEDLFADVEELQEYGTPQYTYNKTNCNNSVPYLVIQLHNYCSVLNSMLLSQYPSPKSIPTDLIFEVICRGLAVTSKTLAKRQTTNIMCVQKSLPDVHGLLLSHLKALIVTCKRQLLPYSHLICKLISQTLEWTESDFSGNEKQFVLLRMSAYEVLCNWLAATGNGSCVEVISSVVISNTISDVTSKKKIITLKEANRQNKGKSQEQTPNKISAAASDKLCYTALKALQFLLKFAGFSLKPEEHKFLQENVVKLIVQVQRSVPNAMGTFAAPFCRLELYTLLLELVLQPSPKWPPPTHFALRLLTRGLNDGSPQISSFCSTALSMTTVIIHPQYSNGGFPPCESSEGNRSQREVQLEWKKVPAEVEKETPVIIEENIVDSNGVQSEISGSEPIEVSPKEKANDVCDESDASSNEDSRNTITFFKSASDSNKNDSKEIEGRETAVSPEKDEPSPKIRRTEADTSPAVSPEEDEPSPKIRRTEADTSPAVKEDERPLEKPPSKTQETQNKVTESDQSEAQSNAKSLSPESGNEENQLKKRYFLRSITKGSSEEPEEAVKRTFSVDSLKSISGKGSPRASPSVQSAAKRPRTRALFKAETNPPEMQKTAEDEDEDILEVFDDSLVD